MALKIKNNFEAGALPEQPVDHYPDLPEPTGEKIMIEWGDGWIKAGNVEYKKWTPVARRHKKGFESKSSSPWEGFIQEVIGLPNSHVLFREYPCQRDRYKYYSKMLGIRPTKFVDMWNCCNAKAFIPEDVRDLANKFCRGAFGHYDTQKIANLIKYKENIFQMIDDGQYNVVPFIVNTTRFLIRQEGKEHQYITPSDASELRKVLGKSAWKKVCKNSVSRNNKIAHLGNNFHRSGGKWAKCLSLPTGLIPSHRGQRIFEEEEVTILKNLKMVSKTYNEKDYVLTTVFDAKNMSSRLGYRLPKGHTKWKFEQWEEYHEQMVELTNKKKYSDEKFDWLKPIKNEYTSPCGNYTAHVLDSLYDIAMEGKAMKHCVAGYGTRVKDQKYLVISVRDDKGKRYSTLGCNVKEPVIHTQETGYGEVQYAPEGFHRKLTFSQHYMACNQRIADKKVEMFASKIIEDINFKLKYLKQEK